MNTTYARVTSTTGAGEERPLALRIPLGDSELSSVRRLCIERYGIYIAYDDPDSEPLQLDYDRQDHSRQEIDFYQDGARAH